MIRAFGRAVTSRLATMIIDLLVITLMVLSLYEMLREFVAVPAGDAAKEIIGGISVIMIGWGVALEERASVRDVFGIRGDSDEAWQEQIDRASHGVGVMLLLTGLFAEIFLQLVHIPKSVISTESVRDGLLAIATFFVVFGFLVLVLHVVKLATMKTHRDDRAPPPPSSHGNG